jgi:hypothetical protein
MVRLLSRSLRNRLQHRIWNLRRSGRNIDHQVVQYHTLLYDVADAIAVGLCPPMPEHEECPI